MAKINTSWTDHLHTKTTHAAKVIRIALWLYHHHIVAVETGKGRSLLAGTQGIKTERVSTLPEHYCS
jgi:hypothetical protein